ncbi:MAG: cytochrome c3 family protein [Candidatus Zixiibacteriota bacterium]
MHKKSILVAALVLTPLLATAGSWHIAGSLNCDDCHLQHGSDQQSQINTNGYNFLLRKNSVNELCLSCHDGTNSAAPDVVAPVTMYGSSPTQESGAGYFSLMGIDNANGHALGLLLPTPLATGGSTVELNCVSCHAAHGNGNYRNLLVDPANTGAELIVKVGTNVFQQHPPDVPPTSAGSAVAYARENIGYVSGISAWCSSCHTQLAQNNLASIPAHFNSHPSDVSLDAFLMSTHVDAEHWTDSLGEGFAPGGAVPPTPRVPFQAPNAHDFAASQKVASSNQVSCMSCHKSHGSGNRKALVWPYLESVENSLAGCQQCHNK